MGTRDFVRAKVTGAAEEARRAVGSFAAQHSDRAGAAVDRAAGAVDARTGGRFSERLDGVRGAARDGLARAAGDTRSFEGWGTPMRGGTAVDGTPLDGPR